MDKIKKIIAIASAKGGVGKSTCTISLAKALVNQGKKVGILDADLMGPSIPSLLGLKDVQKDQIVKDGRYYPVEIRGIKVLSMALLIKPDQAVALRSSMLVKYLQAFWHNSEWGELDYLLIDMPPGTGDIQLTLAQNMNLSAAIIITIPHNLSHEITTKSIKLFEQVKVPIIGIIENMSGYICSHCQQKSDIFGQEGRKYEYDLLAKIPIDPGIYEDKSEKIRDLFTNITEKMDSKLSVLRSVKAFDWDWQSDKGKPEFMAKVRDDKILYIDQKNDSYEIDLNILRQNCQCAICKQYPPKANNVEPIRILSLGNYAIKIEWNDNHNSSIYDYHYLAKLADQ